MAEFLEIITKITVAAFCLVVLAECISLVVTLFLSTRELYRIFKDDDPRT